jgi:hypothetical protein
MKQMNLLKIKPILMNKIKMAIKMTHKILVLKNQFFKFQILKEKILE